MRSFGGCAPSAISSAFSSPGMAEEPSSAMASRRDEVAANDKMRSLRDGIMVPESSGVVMLRRGGMVGLVNDTFELDS